MTYARHHLRATHAFAGVALALLGALGSLSCGREPTGGARATGNASINLGPVFQTSGSSDVTSIRVTIFVLNPSGSATRRTQLKQVTLRTDDPLSVTDDGTNITIRFQFSLQGGAAIYEVEIGAYDDGGTQLYSMSPVVFSEQQLGSNGGVTVTSTAVYVGPGASATKIVISPKSAALRPGDTQLFSATAFDGTGAPILNAPFRFSSDNPQVASVADSRVGSVKAVAAGSARITVSLPDLGLTDAAIVGVANVAPTALTLVQGADQTAPVGTTLPQAVRVQLVAGTAPVAGLPVTFAAGSGGSVSPVTVVTDANGNAETRWTLGSTPGSQTLTASASGVPNLSVTATASPPPSVVTIQSATPLSINTATSSVITVFVTQGGVPQPGAQVTFKATPSSGTAFTPQSAATDATGKATTTFTAATAGSYSVIATTGTSSSPAATITVIDGAPASIAKFLGDAQTVTIGQAFPVPLVVLVQNAAGQPIEGVAVTFTIGNGSLSAVTNSAGLAAAQPTLSAQSQPGAGTAVATVASKPSLSVTFSFTIRAP